MRTSIKTLTTICSVIISLSLSAQRNHNDQPQPNHSNQNHSDDKERWQSNHHGGSNWNGNVSVHIGGYPNYYGTYYGYNNFYNAKKAARNSIRQSAQVIGQALQFSDWNDTYSPWLAKAIRHQQFAKQLYFWGDYQGALNHAERAGFLAWNTLSYFNNSYGYDDGFAGDGYQNPYSDPNNPYYRQSNPNNTTQPNTSSEEDYGYRKNSTEQTTDNSASTKKETESTAAQKISKTELDGSLPATKASDKELLKMSAKELDIE